MVESICIAMVENRLKIVILCSCGIKIKIDGKCYIMLNLVVSKDDLEYLNSYGCK